MKMNYTLTIAAVAAATLLSLSACEKKTAGEKVADKVGDALDSRPNEKLKDAGEDIKDAAKDAGNGIKDAAGEVKDAAQDAVKK
jgi:hypothetical protein